MAQSDAALTGDPGNANKSPYPRAILVSLPPNYPRTITPPRAAPVASASTPDTSSSTPATQPPDASSLAAAPSSAPADAPPAQPSPPAAAPDVNMTRLAITPTSPVITTNPPSVQEQVVILETSLGRIVIELDDAIAPKTCENFRKLVSEGFYNHTTFHRVIPKFMIQGGDPNTKSEDRSTHGQGGPGYKLPAEIHLHNNEGAVAMARLPDVVNPQRESNGSQFYICVEDCPSLDNQYTVFAHVIKGMDVANKIANQPRDSRDNPLTRLEMEASLVSKNVALGDDSAAQ